MKKEEILKAIDYYQRNIPGYGRHVTWCGGYAAALDMIRAHVIAQCDHGKRESKFCETCKTELKEIGE